MPCLVFSLNDAITPSLSLRAASVAQSPKSFASKSSNDHCCDAHGGHSHSESRRVRCALEWLVHNHHNYIHNIKHNYNSEHCHAHGRKRTVNIHFNFNFNLHIDLFVLDLRVCRRQPPRYVATNAMLTAARLFS